MYIFIQFQGVLSLDHHSKADMAQWKSMAGLAAQPMAAIKQREGRS